MITERFYCGTIEVAEAIQRVLDFLNVDYEIVLCDGEVELIVYKED